MVPWFLWAHEAYKNQKDNNLPEGRSSLEPELEEFDEIGNRLALTVADKLYIDPVPDLSTKRLQKPRTRLDDGYLASKTYVEGDKILKKNAALFKKAGGRAIDSDSENSEKPTSTHSSNQFGNDNRSEESSETETEDDTTDYSNAGEDTEPDIVNEEEYTYTTSDSDDGNEENFFNKTDLADLADLDAQSAPRQVVFAAPRNFWTKPNTRIAEYQEQP